MSETTATAMREQKKKICVIFDFEGFFTVNGFQIRELGYCDWQNNGERFAFYRKIQYRDLSFQDRRTVNYARKNIHGLTYQPRREECAYIIKPLL